MSNALSEMVVSSQRLRALAKGDGQAAQSAPSSLNTSDALRVDADAIRERDFKIRENQAAAVERYRELIKLSDRPDLAVLIPSDEPARTTRGATLALCIKLGLLPETITAEVLNTVEAMVGAIERGNLRELDRLVGEDIKQCRGASSGGRHSDRWSITPANSASAIVFSILDVLGEDIVKGGGVRSSDGSVGITQFILQLDKVGASQQDRHMRLIHAAQGISALTDTTCTDGKSFNNLHQIASILNKNAAKSKEYLARQRQEDEGVAHGSAGVDTKELLAWRFKQHLRNAAIALVVSPLASSCVSVGEAGRFATSLFDFQGPNDGRTLFGLSVTLGGLLAATVVAKWASISMRNTLKRQGYHKDWLLQLWQGFKATADEYADTFHSVAQIKLQRAIVANFKVPLEAYGDGPARTEAVSRITTMLAVAGWDDATPMNDGQKDYSKRPDNSLGRHAWILSDEDIFHLEKIGALAGIKMYRADIGKSLWRVRAEDRALLSARVKEKLADLLNREEGYIAGARNKALNELKQFAMIARFMGNSATGEYFMPWGIYCPGRWEDLKEFQTINQNIVQKKWEELKLQAAAGDQSAKNMIEEMYRILGRTFAGQAREFSAQDQPKWVQGLLRTDAAKREYAIRDEIIDALCADPDNTIPKVIREATGISSIPRAVHEFMVDKAAAYLCFGVAFNLANDRGINPDIEAVEKLHLAGMNFNGDTPLADYERALRQAREEKAEMILRTMTSGVGNGSNFGDYANPRRLADVALMMAILKCSEGARPGRLDKYHLNVHKVQYYFQLFQDRLIEMDEDQFDRLVPWLDRFSGLFQMADYFAQFGGAMSVWINTMSIENGENPDPDRSRRLKIAREQFIMYRLVQTHKSDGSGVDEALRKELGGKRWKELLKTGQVTGLPGATEFDAMVKAATGSDGRINATALQRAIFTALHDHLDNQPSEDAFERAIRNRNGRSFLDPNTWMGREIDELRMDDEYGYSPIDRSIATARFLAQMTGRRRVEPQEINNNIMAVLEPMDPGRYLARRIPEYNAPVVAGSTNLSRSAYNDGVMAIQAPAAVFAEVTDSRLLKLWETLRCFAPAEERRRFDDHFAQPESFSAIKATRLMQRSLGAEGAKDWDPCDLQLQMVNRIGAQWNGKLDKFLLHVLDSEDASGGCKKILSPATIEKLDKIADQVDGESEDQKHTAAKTELAKMFGIRGEDPTTIPDAHLIARIITFKPVERAARHRLQHA